MNSASEILKRFQSSVSSCKATDFERRTKEGMSLTAPFVVSLHELIENDDDLVFMSLFRTDLRVLSRSFQDDSLIQFKTKRAQSVDVTLTLGEFGDPISFGSCIPSKYFSDSLYANIWPQATISTTSSSSTEETVITTTEIPTDGDDDVYNRSAAFFNTAMVVSSNDEQHLSPTVCGKKRKFHHLKPYTDMTTGRTTATPRSPRSGSTRQTSMN